MKFVPGTEMEVLEKMQSDGFRGSYYIDQNGLIWEFTNGIVLDIVVDNGPDSYIGVSFLSGKRKCPVTHWHPDREELYEDLLALNMGKYVFLRKRPLWPMRENIVIMERKKWDSFSSRKKKHYCLIA